MVKKYGALRGLYGVSESKTPYDNLLKDNQLEALRGFTGFYLYPYAHTRACAHTRTCKYSKKAPYSPVSGFNPLNDRVLRYGVWSVQSPVKAPETPSEAPYLEAEEAA